MAISKKGFRKIIANDQNFSWKFKEKIIITNDEIANSFLIIDFGWYDVWLYVNDPDNKPPDFEPKSITPKFIKKSIVFALNIGWKGGKMELVYTDRVYKKK